MKKYLLIYKTLLILNLDVFLEYRASLLMRLFSRLLYTTYHILTIVILTNVVSTFFGWTQYELLLLASTYSVFVGAYHLIISHNMIRLSELIYQGNLDFLLLKPVDSQFSVSFWLINYVDAIRVIVGILLTGFFLHNMHISISLFDIVQYVFFMILGLNILYSIWLLVITLTIFNPRLSNIVDLLFHITEISRYPGQMYQRVSASLFVLVFPFTLILIPGTRALLHGVTYTQTFQVVAASIVLTILARFFWKFALRSYTSASS